MNNAVFANEALLRRLNAAVVAGGIVVALAASGLGIGLLLSRGAENSARADRDAAIARGQAAEETIASAQKIPDRRVAARLDQQIESFGTALAQMCRDEGVVFSSFDNSGEAGVFTTRYGGATAGSDWKSAEARVTIRGRLADIYTVLGKLKGHAIPFEVIAGTLDSAPGERQARAALTIAAIVRDEKASSTGRSVEKTVASR